MIDGFAYLRLPRPEDIPVLAELASKENPPHQVLPVSWIIEKAGRIVGYLHVSPSILGWLSTTEMTPRDCFHALNTVENLVAIQSGSGMIQYPVPKESPMHDKMVNMGFRPSGEFTLFTKGLLP